MKIEYLKCLKKLKQFRKSLISKQDTKRGKMYFSWIETKTEKIQNEEDEQYIYKNIVNYTLKKYKIDKYNYERLNDSLKEIIDKNYIFKDGSYVFNSSNISYEETITIAKKVLFKRGNVVWVDFGFNIGNEFGGMHPAIILKGFDKELFVLPVSSKKPKEYKIIEQELEDGKITIEESQKRKRMLTAIIQLDNIYRFKDMIRWTDITRMRKVSWLRINFSGTIGKISGEYINIISRVTIHSL